MSLNSQQKLLDSLNRIKNGDLVERNALLNEYRPFIWKTAVQLCKRTLDWGNDDELSEALIAFNNALDTYKVEAETPFLPYARVVIQNRLKDFFRKQGKFEHEYPLELELKDGEFYAPGEHKAAWEQFHKQSIEEERQEEIIRYEQLIEDYGISFEDLVLGSPKHRDSRETLVNIARLLVEKNELIDFLINKKQLPLRTLLKLAKVNRKTLERNRKFIIATALVLYYKEEFIYLWSYINVRN